MMKLCSLLFYGLYVSPTDLLLGFLILHLLLFFSNGVWGVCVCLSSSSCRSLSQERSSTSSWTDLMSQPHKHKELANYCSLLQEHYHQCYVTGNTVIHC